MNEFLTRYSHEVIVKTQNGSEVRLAGVEFARGFVALRDVNTTDRPEFVPKSWLRSSFDRWTIWHDRRVTASSGHTENSTVMLLGSAIDLDNPLNSGQAIADSLASALSINRSRFFDRLSRLSGKYVVFDSSHAGTFAQSDAAAFTPIYVAPKRLVFGSHQNLVRLLADSHSASPFGRGQWWRENGARTYPGYYTHWRGVFFVPANHELDLVTLSWLRIPMPQLTEISLEEAVDRLDADFSAQMTALSNRSPVLGVTAGADSRVSLAASLQHQSDFKYFTYGLMNSKRRRLVQLDLATSRRIAQVLSLGHYRQLLIDGPLVDGELKNVLDQNSPRHSNLNLANAYLENFRDRGVHVRSNGFEIATAYYRKVYGMKDASLSNLVDIHVFKKQRTQDTVDAIVQYLEQSRVYEADGYDPLDLYFWEIQLGSWQANVMYDSDPTFDSHSIINSRSILSYLNSLPVDDRLAGRALQDYAAKRAPKLSQVPINGG